MPKPLVQSTGRRKEAVARVRLRPGTGTITVNGRPVENYFPSETHRMILSEPLRLTNTNEVYDVDCAIDVDQHRRLEELGPRSTAQRCGLPR